MNKDFLYPLRLLHGRLHEANACRKLKNAYLQEFQEKLSRNPKTVFLVMTPEHGNLGDHAIASAEIQMLREMGTDYVEITGKTLSYLSYHHQISLMNGCPILINGGGNLGTLWPHVEALEREITEQNPKSPIAILPNTIYYGDSQEEQKEFQKSIRIYNSHPNLRLYAREKTSYEVMSRAYRNVKLIPDMVLSLHPDKANRLRSGCILCLRGDCEKTRTVEQERMLREQIAGLFRDRVQDVDMVKAGSILPQQREEALKQQFELFSGAELVVTDRLHGMIFCAVTGTPCVVLNSRSPKVRGCYEWIRNLDYICFADDVSQVREAYESIPKTEHSYDNTHLHHYYQELKTDLTDQFRWR